MDAELCGRALLGDPQLDNFDLFEAEDSLRILSNCCFDNCLEFRVDEIGRAVFLGSVDVPSGP
jgi:hypothetical protein